MLIKFWNRVCGWKWGGEELPDFECIVRVKNLGRAKYLIRSETWQETYGVYLFKRYDDGKVVNAKHNWWKEEKE